MVSVRLGPSLLDSSLFSVERDSGQPEGRKRIAQRFIAGSRQPGALESRRDDRNHAFRLSPAGILSSLRDFRAGDSEPSDKSLGYFRSSLRDSRSEARRLRSFRGREGPAPFQRKQRRTTEIEPTVLLIERYGWNGCPRLNISFVLDMCKHNHQSSKHEVKYGKAIQ